MKDYYRVLNVSQDATHDEIKRRYKLLAKKHHPDTAVGAGDHTELFKQIAEAYAILGHPDSRRKYDQERAEKSSFRFSQPSPYAPRSADDIMSSLFGRSSKHRFGSQQQSGNTGAGKYAGFADLFVDDEVAVSSSSKPVSATLSLPLHFVFKGGEVEVSGLPGGLLCLTIPSGVDSDSVLAVKTASGPVELRVRLEDEPPFRIRNGQDLETEQSINVVQAILGSHFELAHPNGESFTIQVPPGTQPNCILRLRGLGLPGGDLLIHLKVHLPKRLSAEEQRQLREFARVADIPL